MCNISLTLLNYFFMWPDSSNGDGFFSFFPKHLIHLHQIIIVQISVPWQQTVTCIVRVCYIKYISFVATLNGIWNQRNKQSYRVQYFKKKDDFINSNNEYKQVTWLHSLNMVSVLSRCLFNGCCVPTAAKGRKATVQSLFLADRMTQYSCLQACQLV